MPEFFHVLPPRQALQILLDRLCPLGEAEQTPTVQALGRVTAAAIMAREDLPAFPRSTVDGYSLRAADTFGATEGLPAYFAVRGEVPMGQAAQISVSHDEAALAHTGGVLAHGADAVVMLEHTHQANATTLEVARPVAPGENVVQPGEDVRTGEEVLPAGHCLRAQDLGGLMALGITEVSVARRPRVAILSLGDEIVPPEVQPGPGQVRDINSYTLAAQVQQAGGIPLLLGIAADNFDQQLQAARQGLAQADMLIISAGSSVSVRDVTAQVIENLGAPGVLVHGLALRPGKPAIVGLAGGKPVLGLPGNPVSAMIVFSLLARPLIYHLCGCRCPPEPPSVLARLSQNIPSAAGREDYAPVLLKRDNGRQIAHPVFGKSSLIFTLMRADGLVMVPLDRGGLYSGEEVTVQLFQP
ncbi:MAG: molybdopterin molybdotransferase MoeA [SAR202 cluster bacterium]|nr:molybdopterin molybdotransferase MoeA [SAR202 cluster bacterium]